MVQELIKHVIDTNEKLAYLIHKFLSGTPFVGAFVFNTDELRANFFSGVGVDLTIFEENYYFFDPEKKIHIAESSEGYIWISTMGVVARTRITKNEFVNAVEGQAKVLIYLLNEALLLSQDENSLDIDGFNYSQIEMLSPLIFHHSLFYYEVLAKAYLSIFDQKFQPKHSLEYLLDLVKKAMYNNHHNNTLFHSIVIPPLEEIVRHISTIPGKFNEAYVKYDANALDTTTLVFNPDHLETSIKMVTETCEIITDLYYNKNNSFYIEPHLYERLISKCTSEEQRNSTAETYGFLLKELMMP